MYGLHRPVDDQSEVKKNDGLKRLPALDHAFSANKGLRPILRR